MHKLFRTIKVEHDVPVEGTVKGEIPSWVRGSLYRNGPGMFEIGDDKYNSWFDGLAMFQRFHIADKKVSYQSRYLHSDTYNKNVAGQRIAVNEFGTFKTPDPCQNIFRRFLTKFVLDEPSDNCNVNFFPLQDELYAITEPPFIHRINQDTLESLEKVDLSKVVAVNLATAHPHWDSDGTIHNLAISCKGKLKQCIIKIPAKQEPSDKFPAGEIVATIDSAYKASINYAHSFGMTDNYYIIIQQPLMLNFLTIMVNNALGKPINAGLQYYENIKSCFRIIDKKTGKEVNSDIRYESNPFMFWHQINAYEDNGHVVVDFCAEKDGSSMEILNMKNLASDKCESVFRKYPDPEPRRYVLPLKVDSGSKMDKNLVTLEHTTATAVRQINGNILCKHETLAETGFEFPQINYAKFNGRKYKFAYGVGFHQQAPIFNTLCKIDLETKTFVEWQEENCYPSEPVFVANPDGKDEDHGVLLSAVNRTDFELAKNAFFLVLDAKTMKELARVEFNVPRFPKDFHGLFKSA